MLPILVPGNSCQKKVDDLGWADGFVFVFQGVSFGVRTTLSEDLAQIRELVLGDLEYVEWDAPYVEILFSFLRGAEAKKRGTKNFHILYVQCTEVKKSLVWDEILQAFPQSLKDSIRALSRHTVSLAASRWEFDGKAAIVLGPLETELADGMRADGWALIDEEDVVFGLDGRRVAGLESQVDDSPLLFIGEVDRVLSGAEAALRLLEPSFSARIDPVLNLEVLSKAVVSQKVLEVSRLSLADANKAKALVAGAL